MRIILSARIFFFWQQIMEQSFDLTKNYQMFLKECCSTPLAKGSISIQVGKFAASIAAATARKASIYCLLVQFTFHKSLAEL